MDVRQYNQLEFAEVMERFVTNGIFPDSGNQLIVEQSSPSAMSVEVETGKAWINGYYYSNTTPFNLTISASDVTNPRIDLVVLRLDVLADRLITAEVLTGVPSPSPVAPTPTQNASIFEYPLAEVLVNANAVSITNANISPSSTLTDATPRNAEFNQAILTAIQQAEDNAIQYFEQFGLGDEIVPSLVANFNNFRDTGFYRADGTSLNAPSGFSTGVLMYIKGNVSADAMLLFDTTNDRFWLRTYKTAIPSGWREWQEILTAKSNRTQKGISGGHSVGVGATLDIPISFTTPFTNTPSTVFSVFASGSTLSSVLFRISVQSNTGFTIRVINNSSVVQNFSINYVSHSLD